MNKIFDGMGHITFRVKDLGRSLDFYVNKLGFEKMFYIESNYTRQISGLPSEDIIMRIQYLRIQPYLYLELFPCADQEVMQFNGVQSFSHFCLHVKDIKTAINDLNGFDIDIFAGPGGVKISEDYIAERGKCGSFSVWIEDPDGNRIELMQLTDESKQIIFEDKYSR